MRLVLIFAIHFSTRFIILTYLRSHYRQPSTRNASNTLVTSERIFAIHFSTRFIVNARIGFVQRMFSTRALRRSTLKAIYVHRLIVVRDIINLIIQKTHIDDKFFSYLWGPIIFRNICILWSRQTCCEHSCFC